MARVKSSRREKSLEMNRRGAMEVPRLRPGEPCTEQEAQAMLQHIMMKWEKALALLCNEAVPDHHGSSQKPGRDSLNVSEAPKVVRLGSQGEAADQEYQKDVAAQQKKEKKALKVPEKTDFLKTKTGKFTQTKTGMNHTKTAMNKDGPPQLEKKEKGLKRRADKEREKKEELKRQQDLEKEMKRKEEEQARRKAEEEKKKQKGDQRSVDKTATKAGFLGKLNAPSVFKKLLSTDNEKKEGGKGMEALQKEIKDGTTKLEENAQGMQVRVVTVCNLRVEATAWEEDLLYMVQKSQKDEKGVREKNALPGTKRNPAEDAWSAAIRIVRKDMDEMKQVLTIHPQRGLEFVVEEKESKAYGVLTQYLTTIVSAGVLENAEKEILSRFGLPRTEENEGCFTVTTADGKEITYQWLTQEQCEEKAIVIEGDPFEDYANG